ncbi:hypothetical protein DMENIID0001_149170 [Sergentomyia squamirostris]
MLKISGLKSSSAKIPSREEELVRVSPSVAEKVISDFEFVSPGDFKEFDTTSEMTERELPAHPPSESSGSSQFPPVNDSMRDLDPSPSSSIERPTVRNTEDIEETNRDLRSPFGSPSKNFVLLKNRGQPRKFDRKDMWTALMAVKSGMSISKAATSYKVSGKTLKNYMMHYGIKSRRSHKDR